MFLGRSNELATIGALLDQVRAGGGGGLCLRGEPGIGKSALLKYVEELAVEMRVLSTEGVPPEADLPFAALHRLLLPVVDRIDQLPLPQSHALEVAFGRAYGPMPDRFLVALATLSLLSEAASDGPVLCVVDDAHWIDQATMDVLAFAARRLEDEPIAVIIAARDGEGRQLRLDGIVDVPIVGLESAAAAELLARHDRGRLTTAQRRVVLATADGNPLALRELPEAVLETGALADPLPLTAALQHAFLARIRRHDARTRRLLVLLAADGSGRPDTIRDAAAKLDIAVDDAWLGGIDDLVHFDGTRITFNHPLMRAAIYHAATPLERRQAHRVLAYALQDHPGELHRYAWHLGQAAEGRDEETALVLERSAAQAVRRGGRASGAAALARAAELSESDHDRGRRLTDAASAFWHGGDVPRAQHMLGQVEELDNVTDEARLGVAELRALLESTVGTPADALDHLRPVIPGAMLSNLPRAMPLLLLYGEVGYKANRPDAWAELAGWLDQIELDDESPDGALLRLLRGSLRVRAGKDPRLDPGDLERLLQLDDPARLTRAAGMTWAIGEYELRGRLLRKAITQARAVGAAGTLAWALEYLVLDELTRSRFSVAEAYTEEGYRLAVETGQANTACRHLAMLAFLAALLGRTKEARELADKVLVEAGKRRLADCVMYAYLSLGHLELAAGKYRDAIGNYEAMRSGVASTMSGLLMHSLPEHIEALVRSRQVDRAAELLDQYEQWTSRTSSPELEALTARCRGLMMSGPDADSEYIHSLKLLARADSPMELARSELLFGEHLRRQRRRGEAQRHLRSALETFRRLGTALWADRATDELRAAGGSDPHVGPMLLTTLTPQERRIAIAVSEGATNREVAAQLFLSPRTVDYHLRKIFQKIGISARTELIRLAHTNWEQPNEGK